MEFNLVYSTNPNVVIGGDEEPEIETLEPSKQKLRVYIEKSGRAGKVVTVVKGFVGNEADLQFLAKQLKTKCGVGGSAKDGEVLIQGDLKEKVAGILQKMGYANTK